MFIDTFHSNVFLDTHVSVSVSGILHNTARAFTSSLYLTYPWFIYLFIFLFFLGGLSLTHQNAEQLFLHTRHINYQTTLDE